MIDPKLKPCPFCGGAAEMVEEMCLWFVPIYYVRCLLCRTTQGEDSTHNDTDDAATVWNTRKEVPNE